MSSTAAGHWLPQASQRISRLAASFFVMFGWFWVLAYWFPLREGRDIGTYFLWFRGFFEIEPEFPLLMLFRTPLTPLFYGTCFEFLEETGIELVLALLYAGSITAVFAVLCEFSSFAAWTLNVLFGANLWLFRSFNAVGSETLQTVLLCLWFAWMFFAMKSSRAGVWAGSAALVFLMVLNRPGNQVFVLSLVLPFFIAHLAMRRRIVLAGTFVAVYATLHFAFCLFNYVRYGEFCIAQLGDAHVPFYRLFVQEHLISPENGPASRELAQFVEEKILTIPVYTEYEITRDVFFRCSTQRMFNSLIYTLQKEGISDYSLLRKAGMESIWQDPKGSLLRYLDHLVTVFDYRDRKPFKISNLRDINRAFAKERQKLYDRYIEKGLGIPTEGDLVPSMPFFLAREGRDENRSGLQRAVKEWKVSSIPPFSAPGDQSFEISRRLIPNYYWFLFGAICLLLARLAGPVDIRIPLLTSIALIGLLVTLFGSVQWEFRYPFDPIFTAFALHAACGPCAWLRRDRFALLADKLARVWQHVVRRLKVAR